MFRRYNRWQSRFDQPDRYDGSYSLTNPQSFNRYAYVNNDPVNFVDPSGLMPCAPGNFSAECDSSGFGGWGGGFSNGNGWGNDPDPGTGIVGGNFFSDVRYIIYTWWEDDDDKLRYFNLSSFGQELRCKKRWY